MKFALVCIGDERLAVRRAVQGDQFACLPGYRDYVRGVSGIDEECALAFTDCKVCCFVDLSGQ